MDADRHQVTASERAYAHITPIVEQANAHRVDANYLPHLHLTVLPSRKVRRAVQRSCRPSELRVQEIVVSIFLVGY